MTKILFYPAMLVIAACLLPMVTTSFKFYVGYYRNLIVKIKSVFSKLFRRNK